MTGSALDDGAVAVIGMAVRVPGAGDLEQFWQNLVHRRESVVELDEADLLERGVTPQRLSDPDYVRVGAPVADLEDFDAELFGLTPRDAAATDPQIKLFLETAHATIENAGYDPAATDQTIGVMASVGPSRYATLHLHEDAALASGAGLGLHTLNNSDYAATTTSYRLDLRGPAVTVLTACSSSLVALHLACQSLRAGDCDAIVVGAADVEFPVGHGYLWTPGSILSRTGHCRPFDAAADGTVFGSGAAAVMLKPLAEARRDGDRISAVVLASAVNNDGADKVSFGAPSFVGQASVVMEAMTLAGTDPGEIGYVELHGTGTPLGDPVEVSALTEAYGTLAEKPLTPGSCGIGSVKGNVGHLGPVAGIIGLVKVVLALEREQLPPTINLDEVNPRLELDSGPFAPIRELRAWPRRPDSSRRAAVSSLGIGGSNAHVVLAEAPDPDPPFDPPGPELVVWSGRTEAACTAAAAQLGDWFTTAGDLHFADGAATARHGRTAHPVRGAVVAFGALEAATAVRDPARVLGPHSTGPVVVPGGYVGAEADLRALAVRVPAFASALVVALDRGDEPGRLVAAAWSEGAPFTPELVRVAREALVACWLELGVPVALIAPLVDLPVLLDGDDPERPAPLPVHAETTAEVPGVDPVLAAHLAVLGRAWTAGVDVDWTAAGCPPPRQRAAMPGYPYQRVRHWMPPYVAADAPTPALAAVGTPTRPDASAAWSPVWQDVGPAPADTTEPGTVFVLTGTDPAAARPVLLALRQLGHEVVRSNDTTTPPTLVVDARTFGDTGAAEPGGDSDVPWPATARVVLSSAAADVSGCDPVRPDHAAATTAALTGSSARWLDAPESTTPEQLALGLRTVFAAPAGAAVAVRGARRWQVAARPLDPWEPADPVVALDRRVGTVLVLDAEGSTALGFTGAVASAGVAASLRVVTAAGSTTTEALQEFEDAGPTVDVVAWDGVPATLTGAVTAAVGPARIAAVVVAVDAADWEAVLGALAPAITGHDATVVAVVRDGRAARESIAASTPTATDRLGLDRGVTVLADVVPGPRLLDLLTGVTPPLIVGRP